RRIGVHLDAIAPYVAEMMANEPLEPTEEGRSATQSAASDSPPSATSALTPAPCSTELVLARSCRARTSSSPVSCSPSTPGSPRSTAWVLRQSRSPSCPSGVPGTSSSFARTGRSTTGRSRIASLTCGPMPRLPEGAIMSSLAGEIAAAQAKIAAIKLQQAEQEKRERCALADLLLVLGEERADGPEHRTTATELLTEARRRVRREAEAV